AMTEPFPMTPADQQILADTTTSYRVMDIQRFWQPGPSYRHKAIGGYHAAKLTRYQDLIDCHLGNITTGRPSEADMNVLNMLNAKYIVTSPQQAMINPDALGNAWFVDELEFVKGADAEMDALDTIDPASEAVADEKFKDVIKGASPKEEGDTIFLTKYAPNRLTYHSESNGDRLAVFSEVYFPYGWHATIDGKSVNIGRVNYLLRAMNIPAGKHTVEMWFDPTSIHTTVSIATCSVIIIYLMLGFAIFLLIKNYRPATEEDKWDE
ncbi:MAG: YfhO family protein, partial [Muribaculaceae bacterium]|nr:YfhO family protein [Muribaculaceae bacterium]